MEVEMFKSKAPEKIKDAAANVAEVAASTVQQLHSVVEQLPVKREPTTKAGTGSCIGSGMSIVGNIECNGPAQIYGRIKGELRASDLLIGDGAQIEGSVIAQDVTVCGRVKGTIRAVRVKLQDGGAVEGDIFHRSLSIDENSLFEGSSRRVENPTEAPSVDAKGPQENDMQRSALTPYLHRVEAPASTDWSEATAEPKH
jgi:cytoskeletal protein CcmA (bactofilin family)